VIVYIHPKTHMSMKAIIPLGCPRWLTASARSSPCADAFMTNGRRKEVRRAPVVLMDIQWYLSMPGAIRLSFELKRVNPDVKIIAGGLSATLFARQILRDSAIDFIVRGDALNPVADLVTRIVEGGDPSGVANVFAREFENPVTYAMSEAEFGAADFRDVSWFPSLRRAMLQNSS